MQPVITQLYFVNGVLQPRAVAPGVWAQRPPTQAARGRDRDILLTHLSLQGNEAEIMPLLQSLTTTFQTAFYQSTGGVMSALQHALLTINQQLLEYNAEKKRIAPHLGAAAVAVVRDEQLHLALVGEAYIYVGRTFGLERIPPELLPKVVSLGEQADPNIRFEHRHLHPEDIVLFSDPRISHIENRHFVPSLVGGTAASAQDGLEKLLRQHNARLLMLSFGDRLILPTAEWLPAPQEEKKPPTIEEVDKELPPLPVFKDRSTVTVTTVSAESDTDQEELEQVERIRQQRKAGLTVSAAPIAKPATPSQPTAEKETIKRTVNFSNAEVAEEEEDSADSSSSFADSIRYALGNALAYLSRSVRGLARTINTLGGKHSDSNQEPLTTSEYLVGFCAAILIPLIVVSIVGGVFSQSKTRVTISGAKRAMQEELSQAAVATNNPDRRAHYLSALEQAKNIQRLDRNDPDLLSLQEIAQQKLDELDGIKRIKSAVLYSFSADSRLTTIEKGDPKEGAIYVIDQAQNTLYRFKSGAEYQFNSVQPEPLLKENDAVGQHVTGGLIDGVWRSAESELVSNGISVLDNKGALITLFENEAATRNFVALPLASEWIRPFGITTYSERIYVVDRGNSAENAQIWRYKPNGNDLRIDEEDRSIRLDNLDQAVDMVIWVEDGTPVVLYENGSLRRYSGRGEPSTALWDETILATNGLSQPMVSPISLKIAGSGLNLSLFVLDPGSDRLIEVSRGGTILNQYKAQHPTTGRELFEKSADFVILNDSPLHTIVVADNQLIEVKQ